jgi:predicted flap endonuclease-1-like 5' DNA nuclease
MSSYILSFQPVPVLQGSEEGSLMWYFLLALTVLLLLLLWWIWWEPWYRQQHPKSAGEEASQPLTSAPTSKTESAPVISEVAPPPAKTASASAPEEAVTADDLTRIEGIGPKISGILHEAGIYTFAQLAATDVATLQHILEGKVRIFFPDTWPEQAKLAARGDWSALEALQGRLKGGRR